MVTPDYSGFISIAEAAEQYDTTRTYWYEQIKAGRIDGYELPGRRGTFMKRAEVAQFMQPKPKTFRGSETA